MSEGDHELTERSDDLDEKIAASDIEHQIESLILGGQRVQRLIRAIAIVVAVQIIILTGVVYGGVRIVGLARSVATNAQTIQSACQDGNDFRIAQVNLWEFVIALSAADDRTPEQRERTVKFQKYLAETFAPRDCELPEGGG